MPTTLGVLIAGGAGVRLGLGMPKALVPLAGRTLLARGVATLAALCDEVVVTAPAGLESVLGIGTLPAMARDIPVLFRPDGVPGRSGPLAGLLAGLTGSTCDRAVALGVDLPFVGPALLEALLDRLPGRHAVVPVPEGFPQPLAAAYAPEAAAILARAFAAGERGPTRAIEGLDALRLDDAALAGLPGGLESFLNINTRADLAAAEQRLAPRETTR
jgi:molybdopterin-guanine dinucleotide biosynthesis protein A